MNLIETVGSYSTKAEANVAAAKARLMIELQKPQAVHVGFMESLSSAEAALNEWAKLALIALKYRGDEARHNETLLRRVRVLRDQLVEEYDVQSTNAWVNAEARTIRKAKVEVFAVLRDFID